MEAPAPGSSSAIPNSMPLPVSVALTIFTPTNSIYFFLPSPHSTAPPFSRDMAYSRYLPMKLPPVPQIPGEAASILSCMNVATYMLPPEITGLVVTYSS